MRQDQKLLAEGILFTDMYQLTMAQLYFQMGYHEKLVQFDHYFRSCRIMALTKLVIVSNADWNGC